MLSNRRGQCSALRRFALDSSVLSTKGLSPWLLAQLSNGSRVEELRISSTAFTSQQLDDLFCYFHVPQLQRIEISDVWLMTIIDFLQFCPKVHTIRFRELSSDTRVEAMTMLSLPELTYVEGTVGVLGIFLPLLRDVRWENFRDIRVHTDTVRRQDQVVFDSSAFLNVLTCIAHKEIAQLSLAITFPALREFSHPFFNVGDSFDRPETNVGLEELLIQLSARTAKENGEVLVCYSLAGYCSLTHGSIV